MDIKRLKTVLVGCAIAGMVIFSCEKFSGPEPFLLEYRSQLVTASGQAFQVNAVHRIAINDGGIYVVVNNPEAENGEEVIGIDIAEVGKIIFK